MSAALSPVIGREAVSAPSSRKEGGQVEGGAHLVIIQVIRQTPNKQLMGRVRDHSGHNS